MMRNILMITFFLFILSLSVSANLFQHIYPEKRCALIVPQPVIPMINETNTSFYFNITSITSDDIEYSNCTKEYCIVCSDKDSSRVMLTIIDNTSKSFKSYPIKIKYTGAMYDYYFFFFEVDPEVKGKQMFGKGELVYSSSYSMMNDVWCFVIVVFIIIIVYGVVKIGLTKKPNDDKGIGKSKKQKK